MPLGGFRGKCYGKCSAGPLVVVSAHMVWLGIPGGVGAGLSKAAHRVCGKSCLVLRGRRHP